MPSTPTLRPYQRDWIERLRAAYRSGHRYVLGVAPTGFGKTVCFAYIVAGACRRGHRVLILAHRIELIDQISEKLEAFGVPHSFIAAGYRYELDAQVYVASIQTLVRRVDVLRPPSLIVIDEAHHCTAKNTLGRVLAHYRAAVRLGVTATPVRLSGEGMNETFTALVQGPQYDELIACGALSPVRVFAPTEADLDGVHRRGGDFVASELVRVMDKQAITGDAIAHYRRHADGLPAVAFCVSIEHARHVADQFNQAGYRAAHLDGGMDRETRRRYVKEFKNGQLQVLTSCDLISEGFDCPGIVCGILLRPTESLGLYLQQVGRCLRPADGKRAALILDHAGNTRRHGLPTDPREWRLEGIEQSVRRAAQRPAVAVRVCPQCFAAQPAGRPTCRECGTAFEVKARQVEQVEGELQEVTAQVKPRIRQSDARTFEELVALGRSLRYRNPYGWARHVLRGRAAKRRYRETQAQAD